MRRLPDEYHARGLGDPHRERVVNDEFLLDARQRFASVAAR